MDIPLANISFNINILIGQTNFDHIGMAGLVRIYKTP